MILRKNPLRTVGVAHIQCLAVERQAKASTSAWANDAPCCTVPVPAVTCKRMQGGEGAPPSPGWLMPLETQTLGCSAIRESAPRGQQVLTASSHQLVFQKKTEQAQTGMRE